MKQICADLAAGKIDILIGTHKMLGRQVVFRDLGLLIIDEEQKFGVAAKEKLTEMSVSVDTLTLTATPIPRTLQFSLMGSRDLSVISTPPPNRQPILTESHVFSEEIVRDAVERELARGGQVYFVHNRVEDLQTLQGMVTRLCPKARVAVGHGKMPAEQLERLIMDFIYGEFDVLVSTTIVENGIDIPNANTIIVNNAQHFGLSDLHQLRGRVGRSNQKAYCYLLSPPEERCRPTRGAGSGPSRSSRTSGRDSILPCRTSTSAARATCWGPSRADSSPTSVSRPTRRSCRRPSPNCGPRGWSFRDSTPRSGRRSSNCVSSTTPISRSRWRLRCRTATWRSRPSAWKLYRELDSTKDEAALEAFESRLADRFGRCRAPRRSLLNVVRLRWGGHPAGHGAGEGQERTDDRAFRGRGKFALLQKAIPSCSCCSALRSAPTDSCSSSTIIGWR